jgi:hypothetical protein
MKYIMIMLLCMSANIGFAEKSELDIYHECLELQDEHIKYCNDSRCIRHFHHRFKCTLKKPHRVEHHN